MSNSIFSGLTVNWHFTQVCNMRCKYCFVSKCHELQKNSYDIILGKIKDKFDRINFVGGEPTASPYILDLMKDAKKYGLKVTLVTNGFKLIKNPKFADDILSIIDGIGISVDSLNEDTNSLIGRRQGRETISAEEYISLCKKIKNYGLPLKINTVISRANIDEDFCDFYEIVKPDRIKMFQVLVPNLPTKNNYIDFTITKKEYDSFVARHKNHGYKIVAEDNEHMIGSYIMINSEGCFENNELGTKSRSLVCDDVTIDSAFSEVSINMEKYMYRYA